MRRNTFLFKVSMLRMRTEIEKKRKKNEKTRKGSTSPNKANGKKK
jgi:hypothetical protein